MTVTDIKWPNHDPEWHDLGQCTWPDHDFAHDQDHEGLGDAQAEKPLVERKRTLTLTLTKTLTLTLTLNMTLKMTLNLTKTLTVVLGDAQA